jgi:8-oxo-dGTP pyrophosphatase MutT (NUDIX family)
VIFRERVAGILAERRPNQDAPAGYRRAAVLLPLYESPEGPHVILTKRTQLVPTHKGQISFPGGGFQAEDRDLLATALRESAEEIGLRPDDVRVVGVLDDVSTAASSNAVRPFVGFVPHPYPFQLDVFEIECVIHLPLAPLFERDRFREEVWDRNGRPHSVYFYEYGEHTIWGLTARILKQFVEVVGMSPGGLGFEG